ncbi:hypothetical protein D3C71_1872780 [compost metagenome]
MQDCQVRRHGRLRQSAAVIDVARAHPMFKGVARAFLEVRARRLQPRKNVAPHGIGQRLEDGVGVDAGLRVYLIGG